MMNWFKKYPKFSATLFVILLFAYVALLIRWPDLMVCLTIINAIIIFAWNVMYQFLIEK
jgi:hypothetical protein